MIQPAPKLQFGGATGSPVFVSTHSAPHLQHDVRNFAYKSTESDDINFNTDEDEYCDFDQKQNSEHQYI